MYIVQDSSVYNVLVCAVCVWGGEVENVIELHDRITNSSDTGISIQSSNKGLILRVSDKPLKH